MRRAQTAAIYKDASARAVEQRVEDLLGRMTPEEKIAQITAIWDQKSDLLDAAGEFDAGESVASAIRPASATSRGRTISPAAAIPSKTPYRDAKQTVALVNAMQQWSVTTRGSAFPSLFHEESLHGYAARGATHFPQAIALASSWDPELLTRVFTVVGARNPRARRASRARTGGRRGRDPRWGRIEETYGEDPYLVGELGVAAVRGFQGDTLPLAQGPRASRR